MRTIRFFIFAIAVLLLSSCRREKRILVHAFDKQLTMEEVPEIMPMFDEQGDSVQILQRYLDAWAVRQVMLHDAEQNLSRKEKKFDKEMRLYRESLLIEAYEKKILKEQLDTVISEEEILEIFRANPRFFTNKKALVRVNYVKMPSNHPQLEVVKKMLFKPERSPQETEKLQEICKSSAVNSFFSSDWLLFDEILKEIPIATYNNNELFLEKNKTLELRDADNVYLVHFLSYRMDEKPQPDLFERKRIVRSILHQRRVELLRIFRKDALRKAQEDGEVLFDDGIK